MSDTQTQLSNPGVIRDAVTHNTETDSIGIRICAELEYSFESESDVLLAVEAMPMYDQHLIKDKLLVNGTESLHPLPQADGVGQRTFFTGHDKVLVEYHADLIIERPEVDFSLLTAAPAGHFANAVVNYVFPSRYCESDKLHTFVQDQFGHLSGGVLVQAMADWIYENFTYEPGASSGTTTAIESFVTRRGVCRDYAHVLIAFCRAAMIPARMVSAYALHLEPQDFHAVVEVWLANGVNEQGRAIGSWYLVDATRLAPTSGMARIAVGRDATDISFMTIFGQANMIRQSVSVKELNLED